MQFNWQQRSKRSSISGENPYAPHNYNLAIQNQFYENNSKFSKRQQQQVDPSSEAQRPYHSFSSFYDARYPLYQVDWKSTTDSEVAKVALSSYREDSTNRINVVFGTPYYDEHSELSEDMSIDENKKIERYSFDNNVELSVNYPVTRLQWDPAMTLGFTTVDRLATSSECLRIYEVASIDSSSSNNIHLKNNNNELNNKKLIEKSVLTNSKSKSFNQLPPVTSFDWNYADTSSIITSSIDTTCTLWDLSRGSGVAKTQLIAHDSEVLDVKFLFGDKNVFTSCSSDGSIRVFDLRSLEHSTIIYEPQVKQSGSISSPYPSRSSSANPQNAMTSLMPVVATSPNGPESTRSSIAAAPTPLLKLSTSKYNANHIAAIEAYSNRVIILDLRYPGTPIRSFSHHKAQVNSIEWHPQKNYLLTGSDDCQVLCYDLSTMEVRLERKKSRTNSASDLGTNNNNSPSPTPGPTDISDVPSMSYSEDMEVNGVCWNGTGDWIGVNSGKRFQAVMLE